MKVSGLDIHEVEREREREEFISFDFKLSFSKSEN